jgi:predicted DNA-binding protein
MSRSIDDMMACFEFACLKTKNGLMSRFFYENWEFKLHNKARKLFELLNYLHKKLHYNEKGRRLSLAEISETEAYHLKQIIEKRIEEVQYHHISHIQARILYESYDSQNGFWS